MSSPTGVVERSAAILHAVAAAGSTGARLLDISAETGISRPTVHRILQELGDVGFVQQGADKLYLLGPQLFLLGLNAPTPGWDLAAMRSILEDLAAECGDTVYLAMRQFDGVHYLLRVEGAHPVRALVVDVGDTKPFTASYAGLALLSGMPALDQNRAIANRSFDAPEGWLGETDVSALLRQKMQDVATKGYCAGAGVVYPGISGMAAPVPRSTGHPVLAVSISATEDRLSPERIVSLAPTLISTARRIADIVP